MSATKDESVFLPVRPVLSAAIPLFARPGKTMVALALQTVCSVALLVMCCVHIVIQHIRWGYGHWPGWREEAALLAGGTLCLVSTVLFFPLALYYAVAESHRTAEKKLKASVNRQSCEIMAEGIDLPA